MLLLFREAREAQMPLAEVSIHFASLRITAREMRGGAIIFLFAAYRADRSQPTRTLMTTKELNQLVTQIETHIECWKQFNHFVNIGPHQKIRAAGRKPFSRDSRASSCRSWK